MNKDIVPELLEKIQNEFNNKTEKSKVLKKKILALKAGKATHLDSNEFAIEVGNILADVFRNEITEDVLPDNKMYYNIAKRLIEPNMRNNFDIVSDYSRDVQEVLNKESNISLKAIKPEINQDRIDGIVNKISEYDDFKEGRWLLDEPIKNFTQSIVDDTIKTNADFQYKSGLTPKIVRKEVGSCCDWCKEVVGVYEYPDVPKDVFRRHQRCKCTVDYLPGNGKKQDVWTKKWTDSDSDNEIQERIKFSEDTKETNKLVKMCFRENIEHNAIKLSKTKKTEEEIIKKLSGGDETDGSCSSLAFAYIGNKAGFDVLDFRGGKSQKFFSTDSNILEIANLKGVRSYVEKHTNDFIAVKSLLSRVELNKDYYLATGKHAAIIRKVEKGYEYLELQSPETKGHPLNGFRNLNDKELKNRFMCQKKHEIKYIGKIEAKSIMIDTESLYNNSEFQSLLGFINTEGKNQIKGANGRVR